VGLLTPKETALVRSYGHWLAALGDGWIAPFTAAQAPFLLP
jgi:hypothetical protein